VSVVFQDFVRYHLSAADNVALGNALAPPHMAAVVGAARDAGLDRVVSQLPDGWQTPLARARRGGVDLSGGQWQQVALARALYAMRTGARVLVLDEPTAHLDVRTELDVFTRLAAHRGNASVILISHRLSTVRQVDRIVLLNDGRITEAGTHEQLMAAGGDYAAMFTVQAQRFRRGFEDRMDEGELQ
jgi:ATP-binding cassette subfamily B protein